MNSFRFGFSFHLSSRIGESQQLAAGWQLVFETGLGGGQGNMAEWGRWWQHNMVIGGDLSGSGCVGVLCMAKSLWTSGGFWLVAQIRG